MPHPFRRNQAPVWSQHSTRLVALGAANPLKELRKSNPESMNLRELEISAVDKPSAFNHRGELGNGRCGPTRKRIAKIRC
jgi:hypothetical protein